MSALGELFQGDRNYFILPVPTDNSRNPIIPAQIGSGRRNGSGISPMPAPSGKDLTSLGPTAPVDRIAAGFCALGELLHGDRNYFLLPVAYDNERRPLIPPEVGSGVLRQVAPAVREVARSLRARRGLAAVGECPSFAPYETEGGGCSNIDPSVDAFDYFRSGGQISDTGTVGPVGDPEPTLECPYGSKLNPATGRTECRSEAEAKYTTGSGYVVRTSPNLSIMQQIADAAQREGRARGLSVTCKAIPLGGDLLNNNLQVYGTDCTVNGNPGQDAALLLTGSGFEIAAVEAARVGGSPMMSAPQFASSPGYQYLSPTAARVSPLPITAANTPTVGASPTATRTTTRGVETVIGPPAAPGTPSPGAAAVGSNVLETVAGAAESIRDTAAGFGIPSWALIAGAAGAAYFLLAKGGRR